MHELGVVFHVIDQVEEIAKANQVDTVSKVTLELGEVSTVIPGYLQDCWKWAITKHPILQQAELQIEIIKAVTWCDNCKTEYETVSYGKTCPHCQSEETWLVRGNEFIIKEIEVPESE